MPPAASIALGLVLLVIGGEAMVRGSVRVAREIGISPLMIGIVLIGFGTSVPELVTSVHAARIGSPGIAVGNIVGSNIANILLVLGAAAIITPVRVANVALKRDGVLVLVTITAFTIIGLTFGLTRPVGAGFLAVLLAYVAYVWRQERAGAPEGHTSAYERAEAAEEMREVATGGRIDGRGGRDGRMVLIAGLLAVVGVAVTLAGGELLVDGAVTLARAAKIPESVIGLTIVAVGTSLPELVATIVAAARGHSDVAFGNITGSCIYNVLGIGGVTAVLAPTAMPPQIARFDNLVMVGAAILLILFANSGRHIWRYEGALLVGCYAAYLWILAPA